jgi:very-short-patch-repair endonuclease
VLDQAFRIVVHGRMQYGLERYANEHPDESLGVIAMGVRHANDIREALREARIEGGDNYGGFFEDKGAEPFFVKIMTTAQGDERDHIILSVGYGKAPEGEIVYRWGSLNRRGGERRLNVAVTRAKRRMTVVTSVAAADLDPSRTRARGASLLREFLEYSEHGGDAMPGPDTAPLTPFEISVRDRLTAAHIPVEPHHGGGRHRIDFAAFDKRYNGRPVLAIETDGVGYNASDTARDRDRLRLEVLANRGWRHHRIWSIDWYRDPDGETERVRAAWENASIEVQDPALQHIARTIEDRPVVEGRGRCPIPIRRSGILGYQRDELVQLIQWIESDGVDRDEAAVLAEAMDVLGFTESRGRVGVALRGAIRQARR